jgi:protein-S-isoprenylcysteine O-methyltransferase Ste14
VSIEKLRFLAFSAYLVAWLVLGVAAAASAISRRGGTAAGPPLLSGPVMLGTMLQAAAPMIITLSMGDGPLRPQSAELIGILLLAPLAAGLFTWSLRSAPANATSDTLVTTGAYAWLRHPIYLAFFAMLIATGLIISARLPLLAAAILYLAGSEIRIAVEEGELAERFPGAYSQYQKRTRWRYLPGLR